MESIYNEMDQECAELCKVINKIPGLKTFSSCCGHGVIPFAIWFEVIDQVNLPILLYYIDSCHVPFQWDCKVTTDCTMAPARFSIESRNLGKRAYWEAGELARLLQEHLDSTPNRVQEVA